MFSKDFYNIKNKEAFENIIKDPNRDKISFLIEEGIPENIKILFGERFYDIKIKKDFENIIKNDIW
jgi:hypothetical protein